MHLLAISLLLFSNLIIQSTSTINSQINETRKYQINPNTECICLRGVQTLAPRIWSLKNDETLVIYIYRDKITHEIKLIIPSLEKQIPLPNIHIPNGESLEISTNTAAYVAQHPSYTMVIPIKKNPTDSESGKPSQNPQSPKVVVPSNSNQKNDSDPLDLNNEKVNNIPNNNNIQPSNGDPGSTNPTQHEINPVITIAGDVKKLTFDHWYETQMELFKYSHTVYAIDNFKLRYLIQEALLKNNIYIDSSGIIKDANGVPINLQDLRLRPVLIGPSITYSHAIKGDQLKLLDHVPFLEGLLITLVYPPKILGFITLGKTYHLSYNSLPASLLEPQVPNNRPNPNIGTVPLDSNISNVSNPTQYTIQTPSVNTDWSGLISNSDNQISPVYGVINTDLKPKPNSEPTTLNTATSTVSNSSINPLESTVPQSVILTENSDHDTEIPVNPVLNTSDGQPNNIVIQVDAGVSNHQSVPNSLEVHPFDIPNEAPEYYDWVSPNSYINPQSEHISSPINEVPNGTTSPSEISSNLTENSISNNISSEPSNSLLDVPMSSDHQAGSNPYLLYKPQVITNSSKPSIYSWAQSNLYTALQSEDPIISASPNLVTPTPNKNPQPGIYIIPSSNNPQSQLGSVQSQDNTNSLNGILFPAGYSDYNYAIPKNPPHYLQNLQLGADKSTDHQYVPNSYAAYQHHVAGIHYAKNDRVSPNSYIYQVGYLNSPSVNYPPHSNQRINRVRQNPYANPQLNQQSIHLVNYNAALTNPHESYSPQLGSSNPFVIHPNSNTSPLKYNWPAPISYAALQPKVISVNNTPSLISNNVRLQHSSANNGWATPNLKAYLKLKIGAKVNSVISDLLSAYKKPDHGQNVAIEPENEYLKVTDQANESIPNVLQSIVSIVLKNITEALDFGKDVPETSNSDTVVDDDGPNFRIIGGNAATGSGSPLSNKGRSGRN